MGFRASRPMSAGSVPPPYAIGVAAAALVLGSVAGWYWPSDQAGWTTPLLAQEGIERSFSIAAKKYAFSPGSIEVNQDDLVRITLTSDDIPHSFTIDKYRIAKRVEPGRSVVFEFRADQPGRFPIYCNLAIDDRCREMRGELVVSPRR